MRLVSVRQANGWEKVGIAGVLAYLWRGPLAIGLLFLIALMGIGMLVSPAAVTYVLVGGAAFIVGRRILRRL